MCECAQEMEKVQAGDVSRKPNTVNNGMCCAASSDSREDISNNKVDFGSELIGLEYTNIPTTRCAVKTDTTRKYYVA